MMTILNVDINDTLIAAAADEVHLWVGAMQIVRAKLQSFPPHPGRSQVRMQVAGELSGDTRWS